MWPEMEQVHKYCKPKACAELWAGSWEGSQARCGEETGILGKETNCGLR